MSRPIRQDWSKFDATTEEDIERQIAEDPDLQGFEDIDWSKAVAIDAPSKQAISIRLDRDVLDYFKSGGAGYQGRINRVLRHYMEARRKPAAE
ncbi:MAG: BrnA antitoxin family protein [Beijerinckiaceae bacterium]